MKSETIEIAQKYLGENRDDLINSLHNELTFTLEDQSDLDQVAVWFENFSICFQNGRTNGTCEGEAIFDNPGSNEEGLDDFRALLENDPRFQPLVSEEYWDYEILDEFMREFLKDFVKKHKISEYFQK